MSVAEETDPSPNGSKETTLAVSMSELEHMSTSEMISAQDIAGRERGEVGERAVIDGFQRGGYIFCRGRGGGGTGG